MKKPKNSFLKNLRYLCLVGVIAFGLLTIVGSGGGGGGGTSTPAPPPTDGGDTDGGTIQSSYVSFNVSNAVSLIATENIGTQSALRSLRNDGRTIPTYVFRTPTTEEEAKARSAAAERQDSEEVGCNLIAIDENGVASDAIESLEELNVMYTVLSKDGKTVYIVLDPDYMHNAQGTIGLTSCMMFAIDLQTNEYTCLDQGYAPQKMDTQFRQTISSSQVKPIQMDDNGNIYYLGRPFTVNTNTWCDEWDNLGNCVNEQTDYGLEFDWNTQPVIRKISVKKDADGNPLYNEDGYLLYEDPVSLTPDNNYIDSFLVSKNGILVYTFQNRETGQGGIKMYADGATNALTDDTTGWWGNMFYMVGDSGTVIFGSSAGDAWGNAGIKFAQKHPVVLGAKVVLQLNTSLFTSRNNSPTPSRIIMGDDGYIYGLFNEDTTYWDESISSWVSQARINLFRILPYRQTPIVSIEVTGNWWDAMRGFDVQISKGFAYYVQTDKHPQALYSDRDVIKITKLATGETTTLLHESHTEGGYTMWDDRYELYSWKLVGSKIFFSGFDNILSQVVTGEIDVTKVRQGKPPSEYLTIQAAASALGESARIRDMEIVRPEVVYDPVSAPVITNIYTDPENLYSASIDFSKYMNRTDVNGKVSIKDVAADEEVAFTMKVWSYKTLHIIFDTDATNAATDPLAANTLYGISVDSSAYDYANDWQLDMADNPLLSTTFKTVPDNGWYQSTAIALEGYSDGSVGKYVAKSGSDTWLEYYRLLGGTDGFSNQNFKVELSLQHLSEWGRVTLMLNDAKKIDWANVDWTNTTITDSQGYQWKWRDGHREDAEGNQYYWCNNEACGAGVEGIYDQGGNVYEYIQGHDEDVYGNQYFWYWDDATDQHGYRWYDQSGTYQGIILWIEGYYTDEENHTYVWSFGEYRDVDDPENIVDWDSGHTYTWHSGHYEDENGTEVQVPALEWVQGVYQASDETVISESTYWDMTWVDGYYYQIDPATDQETGETATYYGEVNPDWVDTVDVDDMVINESKNNWEAKLWNFEFSFGQGSQLWGEYRTQTWETTQVNATTDQLLRREWQKIAISVYGTNMVISVIDADGQEIALIEKTDYHNASRTNSGLYFLDLNIEEDAIFMDNVVITELDESGTPGTTLFSEDFSSADLDPTFSNTRYYESDW